MLSDRNYKLLVLSKLRGIGPATLTKLSAIPNFSTLPILDLANSSGALGKALAAVEAEGDAERAATADEAAAKKVGARIICALDEDYPNLLKNTADRPFFLYVRGELTRLPDRSVAVIGTRHPTDHGKLITQRITEFLVSDGWSIVSGLAPGCDGIAHQAALGTGGHTVAVLAHGLHMIAPSQHEALAGKILANGGALVSEYGFGVPPSAYQFVKRDRTQAGLARGVIMMQSDLDGGSLHASRAAVGYGRLLAVPKPTNRDVASRHTRINANLLLCSNDETGKAKLLKHNLHKPVFIIRGRDDYAALSRDLIGDDLFSLPGTPEIDEAASAPADATVPTQPELLLVPVQAHAQIPPMPTQVKLPFVDFDLLLIDANSLGYSAMHQPGLASLSYNGAPTAALFGVLQSLFAQMRAHPAALPVMLWDGRAEWRYRILPEYKGHRSDTEEKRTLREMYHRQVPHIRTLLTSLGIPQVRHPDLEADDLAGIICGNRESDDRDAISADFRIKMVTKDTDWWQNIRTGVDWYSPYGRRLITIDGFSDPVMMKGQPYLSPEEYLQCKALAGDIGDGIDGVEDVGLKTAVKYHRKYNGFESFWGQVDAGLPVSGVVMTKIASTASREIYRRNLSLMDWRESPLVDSTITSLNYSPRDMQAAREIGRDFGLGKILGTADALPVFTKKQDEVWREVVRVLGN